jgi:hypothetical protein
MPTRECVPYGIDRAGSRHRRTGVRSGHFLRRRPTPLLSVAISGDSHDHPIESFPVTGALAGARVGQLAFVHHFGVLDLAARIDREHEGAIPSVHAERNRRAEGRGLRRVFLEPQQPPLREVRGEACRARCNGSLTRRRKGINSRAVDRRSRTLATLKAECASPKVERAISRWLERL